MYDYDEYDDENYDTGFQKIGRTSKAPKKKNYKKERKKDFRKEIRFKQETLENSDE